MADLKMRPRFAAELQCDPETVVAALSEHLGQADPALEGQFTPEHCVLRIPEGRRYFWSPELDVTFEPLDPVADHAPQGVRVRCLFTPRPEIWTGFAFLYSVLGVAGVAATMYGLAQLALDQSPWALAGAPAALALIAFVYGATFIGQGLAATQMYELRTYLDAALERAENAARRAPKTSLDAARL